MYVVAAQSAGLAAPHSGFAAAGAFDTYNYERAYTKVTTTNAPLDFGVSAAGNLAYVGGGMVFKDGVFVGTAPQITQHPVSQSVVAGQSASFTVAATGTGLTYQWFSNAGGNTSFVAISGAISQSYIVANAAVGMSGTTYDCVVTGDTAPSATSNAAALTVASTADTVAPAMPGQLAIAGLGYRLSWQAASDDVAVAGYEVSLDGGASYVPVGNVLFYDVTNRAVGTTDQVRVRAFDAAGNRSVPLAGAVQLATSGAVVTSAQITITLV
jgi:hypothetical protein